MGIFSVYEMASLYPVYKEPGEYPFESLIK